MGHTREPPSSPAVSKLVNSHVAVIAAAAAAAGQPFLQAPF